MFGLKKEPINKMFQKMESDFLYEKIELEVELKSLKKENDILRARLKESPKKFSIAYENETLWTLGKERINKINIHLNEQKKNEMEELGNIYSERFNLIQQKIKEIDLDIQATEQRFSKMLHQIANMVEQTIEDTIGESKELIKENTVEEPKELFDKSYVPNEDENQKTDEISINDDNNENVMNIKKGSISSVIKNSETFTKSEETDEEVGSGEDSLIDQINSIKSQYIVGKVAGEDLFDLQGHRIISKSQVITRQAVNKADREGKLAELIVNMKISGLGED